MINAIIINYGEIYTRGKNRSKFENLLIKLMKRRLKQAEDFEIIREYGRIIIEKTGNNFDHDYIVEQIKNISGINYMCPCIKTFDSSIENIRAISLAHMRENYNDITYKIETSRANKKYPMTSYEICYDIGGYILHNMENVTVNVKTPQVTLKIEIRNVIYIYSQRIKGPSGLPVGSSGYGVLLLSGGIDSPVAGYLMAKRGLSFDAVYFHSPPFTSELATQKVKDLCEQLTQYAGKINLHIINFTQTQLYINDNVDKNKTTIFLKRTMLQLSEIIANNINAKALILGDSVGQVASQTLNSLFVIDPVVTMPILRPLVATDKEEIIKIARQIDTFDISIRPFEDCCTIFVPEHPDLNPSKKVVDIISSKLTQLDELLQIALEEQQIITFGG